MMPEGSAARHTDFAVLGLTILQRDGLSATHAAYAGSDAHVSPWWTASMTVSGVSRPARSTNESGNDKPSQMCF